MSIPMAVVDYIPVGIFLASAILLQRGLYNKMSKGAFAVFSCGTIMVFIAGFYKATWKLLYAAGICDFEKLNFAFFPMQASGFLLAAAGLVAMYFFRQEEKSSAAMCIALVPAVYSGTFIFVVMMCAGIIGMCMILAMIAKQMKRKAEMILFLAAIIVMLGMGYLSSKDFADPAMNWIGEITNIIGQGLLFAGILGLVKAGLKDFKLQ